MFTTILYLEWRTYCFDEGFFLDSDRNNEDIITNE